MEREPHSAQESQGRGVARNETVEKNVNMLMCLLIKDKERDRHDNAKLWPQQDHHNGRKPGSGKGF